MQHRHLFNQCLLYFNIISICVCWNCVCPSSVFFCLLYLCDWKMMHIVKWLVQMLYPSGRKCVAKDDCHNSYVLALRPLSSPCLAVLKACSRYWCSQDEASTDFDGLWPCWMDTSVPLCTLCIWCIYLHQSAFSALTLLVGRRGGHPSC